MKVVFGRPELRLQTHSLPQAGMEGEIEIVGHFRLLMFFIIIIIFTLSYQINLLVFLFY